MARQGSPTSGNPIYEKPVVLVIYREDLQVPAGPGAARAGAPRAPTYDLVIASQPYRARASVEFKARKVVAPLARGLAPGGRLIGIHSHGNDPGLEIIQKIWPGENPFITDRQQLLRAVKTELGKAGRDLNFNAYAPTPARCSATTCTRCPKEISNAVHRHLDAVRRLERRHLRGADRGSPPLRGDGRGAYLDATREVLKARHGLWFFDESYIISRKRDL